MASIRFKWLRVSLVSCGVLLGGVVAADGQSQHDYPEEGTVISATSDFEHVYTIEANDKVFQVLCMSWKPYRFKPPACRNGNRPIAVHDTIHFRRDGDMVYLPGSGSGEQRLLILSTELKILPPLPDTAAMAPESAAVLGLGLEARTLRKANGPGSSPKASTATQAPSSPSTPTGPVLAVPVTGGPPVEVTPSGPVTGGVVTGVPVTGGAPITAIAVDGISASNTSGSGNAPMTSGPTAPGLQWVHFVRLETAAHVYDLACPSKSCSLEHNPMQLGDLLTIRVVKKTAYLSHAGANDEQKFDILDVRSVNDAAGVPPHSVAPVPDEGYSVHPKHLE